MWQTCFNNSFVHYLSLYCAKVDILLPREKAWNHWGRTNLKKKKTPYESSLKKKKKKKGLPWLWTSIDYSKQINMLLLFLFVFILRKLKTQVVSRQFPCGQLRFLSIDVHASKNRILCFICVSQYSSSDRLQIFGLCVLTLDIYVKLKSNIFLDYCNTSNKMFFGLCLIFDPCTFT